MTIFWTRSGPRAQIQIVDAVTEPPEIADIYQTYWSDVVRAMRFYGVPARECEDAAQEAFLALPRALVRYDPSRPLKPWLMGFVYYEALMFLRRTRQAPSAGLPEGELEPADAAPDPEVRAELTEMERQLPRLVRKICRPYREVFLMRYVDGLSVSEVAEALEISETLVRSRAHRARVTFDAALAKHNGLKASAILPFFAPDDPEAWIERLWKWLLRLLGDGFEGPVIPISAPALAAGSALVLAVGAGSGAALHATLAKPPPEALAVAAVADLITPSVASIPSSSPSTSADPSPDPPPTATVRPAPSAGLHNPLASLRAESTLINQARIALDEKKPEAALRELNRHASLYPNGALAGQRRELTQEASAALAARDGGP